jgi:hypothetical protein
MLGHNAFDLLMACGGTADGIVAASEELTPKYRAWLQRFDLPPEEFERQFLHETAALKDRNAVFRMLTPSIPRIQKEEAITKVRRVLLRAAVAVQRDGTTVLTQYLDPYSGKPFLHSAGPRGFKLESRLTVNGQPLQLTTGLHQMR